MTTQSDRGWKLEPCDGRWRSALTHGHTRGVKYSRTYTSWVAMRARCRLPSRHNHKRYAAVGYDPAWESFERFLADMGERPEGCTLDREDGTRGYSKDNCRWATPIKQARNRRNGVLDYGSAVGVAMAMLCGEMATVVAKRYGTSESLPREILKGRSWKDALAKAKEALCLNS